MKNKKRCVFDVAAGRNASRRALHQHELSKMRIETIKVVKGDVLTVPMSVNGGFAMVIEK